ncbi:hypothetical protein EV651_11712 [Kribbella sp. VKM Ac-2571]|uniref:hypothetical protein n=1 Tax=Kribbella sp. VKM Ac-2571 TaxID=2512222 RepID=UPI001060F6B6|nr:hypothetical protein [Kribbella sp. VKM Ac-2571]TDO52822.1 hypothetical protein EV651_11712 [Kribbella sp. VKM Ac-2571]
MSPRAELREPSRDELVAAQQVVDLFAAEALLAIDRYEQAFPAGAPDKERRTADRLAYWWRKLELDDARLDPEGTDAEQILVAAADLALDPENQWGLSLEEASAQAVNRAAMDGRTMPTTAIADLRKDFADAYGGRVELPARDDEWLAQSLTRLARASVLRDVVAEGAQVRVSEPLRAAADELVRQGQRLMDDRLDLARRQETPISPRPMFARQARNFSMLFAYSSGVELTGAPLWADLLMKTPAVALYLKESRDNWRDYDHAVATQLDPAQAQLRSVRTDLANTLDTPPPVNRRDARALRNPHNRPAGPSR